MCNKTMPKPSIDVVYLMGMVNTTAIELEMERDNAGRHTIDGQKWSVSARTLRAFGRSIMSELHDHPERFNNA